MKLKINPIMDSVAQIQIHEFESEQEQAYLQLQRIIPESEFHALLENLAQDIQGLRSECGPGVSDTMAAFLMCVSDEEDSPAEEVWAFRMHMQATLHWLGMNGKLMTNGDGT